MRADGQGMRDQIILQVKTASESKGEWDLYRVIGSLPAAESFAPANPAVCSLVKPAG